MTEQPTQLTQLTTNVDALGTGVRGTVPGVRELEPSRLSADEPRVRIPRRVARARAAAGSQDEAKVRRATLSVAAAVALVLGLTIIVMCVTLIILARIVARPVPMPYDDWHDGRPVIRPVMPRYGWISADEVVGTVIVFGVVSIVLTSLIAWLMAKRAVKPLSEALKLQRHFVADASHELRTPLTALSSRVQILQRRLEAGKPVDELVTQLRDDTTNMASVLDDMLLAAEGGPVVDAAPVALGPCLRQAATSLRPLAEQAGVRVEVAEAGNLWVAAPEVSVTRAVVAVADNAIQHSPAGSSVEVRAVREQSMVVIRVTDHGTGITGVDPDQVFDRFAHGAETGKRRSFGLGLALTAEVVHRYGGDIRVESTSELGTTFAMSFPAP